MTEWKARRFWTAADAVPVDGAGWQVALDGRPVRTPGKQPLILPTRDLAHAIAEEWDAQDQVIRPVTMPLTRAANSAIEKVAPQAAAVAAMLAEYGGTDLLCYRAIGPEALIGLQAAAWDPMVDWAATAMRAPLRMTHGVIPIEQAPESLARLQHEVAALDVFGLTALHDLVTLSGSLILGLAVLRGRIDADEAHRLSQIDETYQSDQWGEDDEARNAAENRLQAMRVSGRFWGLSRTG